MQKIGSAILNIQQRSQQQQNIATHFANQNHYDSSVDSNISLSLPSMLASSSSIIGESIGSSTNYEGPKSSPSLSNAATNDSDDSDDSDDDDGVPIGVDISSFKSSNNASSAPQPPAAAQDTDDSDYINGKAEIIDALVYMFFIDKSVKTIEDFKGHIGEFSPSKYSELVEGSVGYLSLRHKSVFDGRWESETKAGKIPFELALYKDALYGIHRSKCESIATSIFTELNALLGDGVYATHRFLFSRELFEGAARVLHGWLFDNVPGFEALFSKRLEEAGLTRAERISNEHPSLWADNRLGVTSGLEATCDESGILRSACLRYCIMNSTIKEENKQFCWMMELGINKFLVAYTGGEYAGNIDEKVFIKYMVNQVVKDRYGVCLHTGFHTSSGEGNVPDFESNVEMWQKTVMEHFKLAGEQGLTHLHEIKDWFSGFRAVHQCSKEALCSILNLGALASLNKLATIWKDPEEITDCVFLSDGMRKLVAELSRTRDFVTSYDTIRRFVKALARKHQCEDGKKKADEMMQMIVNGTMSFDTELGLTALSGVSPMSDEEKSEYERLGAEVFKAMPSIAREIVAITEKATSTLINLLVGAKGIKFDVDKEIGTDKVVFAIFGPNRGNYGGAEAAVVFKDTVMRHPDTFLTPIAAMGYYQGWYVSHCKKKQYQ